MKKNIKKIITFLSFTLLFVGSSAFAATTWNGASNDCPTVAVANWTTQTGYRNPCWPNQTVNANAGDFINVRVYYHNTGSVTATNTHITLNTPSGSSTSHSIYGHIVSPQGNLSFGPVIVNTGTAQTLTWGTTKWYPNQSGSAIDLSNGTDIDIGDIAPGWDAQGSVVIGFRVGNSTSNCSVSSFTASPTTVASGGASTLSWNTNGCSTVTISNLGSSTATSVNNSGSWVVNPTSTTTYTLNAYVSGGILSQTRSVTVSIPTPQSCSISSFVASPISTTSGGSSTLSWSTNDCSSVSISNGVGIVNNSGSFVVSPTSTTTYTLTATGTNGVMDSRSVNVNVTTQSQNCSIYSFTANGSTSTTVQSGNSANLVWNTNNCSSVYLSGPNLTGNSVNQNGSQIVYPTNNNSVYMITAYGTGGIQQTQSVTVYVNNNYYQNNCSISYFNASPNSISSNGSATLYWNTNNCNSVSISNLNYNVPVSGSQVVYPTYTTTYMLTAYGNGGQQTQSVTVYVNNNYYQNNYNCSISYFTASPNSTTSGGTSTLSWNTNNCSSVSISNLNYNVATSGSQVVYPSYTTTYTLTAYGNGGQQTQSVTVYTNSYNNPVVSSCAVTTVATNVTRDSATLNGMLTNGGYYNTYFEYGPTISLGYQTASRSSNGNTFFNETITGLSVGSVYYYRLVSNCQNGLSKGEFKVFETLGSTEKPIIIQGTTVVGSKSPISLKIENRDQLVRTGDRVYYVVTYKNIGSKKLTHPMVQVVLPENILYLSSSRGTYSENNNTLNVPIEDLNKNDDGSIYVEGEATSAKSDIREIVTTALLVYTNPNGAQENTMAYVSNNFEGDGSLSAAALFSGFQKIGLIGWLIVVGLGLLIAGIVKKYFINKVA